MDQKLAAPTTLSDDQVCFLASMFSDSVAHDSRFEVADSLNWYPHPHAYNHYKIMDLQTTKTCILGGRRTYGKMQVLSRNNFSLTDRYLIGKYGRLKVDSAKLPH